MNYDLNELLGKLTEFLKNEVKTETIIGKEFQLGEFRCIPVIGIGMGFGAGGGEGTQASKGSGAGVGGGAGVGMGPIGFLATRDGQIQFIPTRSSKGLAAAFEKLPDILDKYLDKKAETEKTNV
ncbi:MAG: Sporulation protein YtfJ [Bacteroidetes bacterium]|nr:MAG: Sporulation protein YtfJ [Bacteroidota bacterium]